MLASVSFVLTWSSGFLVAAILTVDVSPFTLLVWRFLPLAGLLLVVVLLTGAARGLTGAAVGRQALIGLFAQFGYCVSVYVAIAQGIATGTTALIDAVQPLVIAVLVGPLLGLKVRGVQWVGLVLGAAGVVLVVQSQWGQSDAHPLAYLFPALAMTCLVVGTLLQRRSPGHTSVLVTLTIHVTVTAVVLVALAAVTGTLAPPPVLSFWIGAIFAAAGPTLAGYGLYWWLLRRVGITALNALLFLIAPATAIGGAILLGEPLTAVTVAGFVLCGAGVAMVLAADRRVTPRPDPAQPSPRTRSGERAGVRAPAS